MALKGAMSLFSGCSGISKNTPTKEIPRNTSPRFQCFLLTLTLPVSREVHGAPAEFMLQTAAVLRGHCCHTWVCPTKYT